MRVLVHCKKPLLFVHHHPHIMDVPRQKNDKLKTHLGSPHDHYVHVTARVRCEHLERDKDLLLLHEALEHATEYPKRVAMGQASFEQIAVIMCERVGKFAASHDHPVFVHSIKIEAIDEGAEVFFEETREGVT